MSMTVVVTRNVAPKFRGFLASCMLEIAPGVYSAPKLNPAVRERIWNVLNEWWQEIDDAGIVMTWQNSAHPCGQECKTIGFPPADLIYLDGIYLSRRKLSEKQEKEMKL